MTNVIKVICAWCSEYMYSVKSFSVNKYYDTSHGICEKCIQKYFKEN